MSAAPILITGGKGMLGRCLQRRLADRQVQVVDLPEVDITRLEQVVSALQASQPRTVIHCAAFTQVDACEQQPDAAWAVNAAGSTNVAIACQRLGVRLIALSTDYVFAGDAGRPYHEWDQPAPRTVYGASKLAGEEAVRRHCPDHAILRIAWLYGPGGPSFCHSMLRLLAEPGEALPVVADQFGNPTSCDVVADAISVLLDRPLAGTFHASCEGEASWFEFAQAIAAQYRLPRPLRPASTAEVPRPAPRPADSRLEKRAWRLHGLPLLLDWRAALERHVSEHPDD